VFYVKFNVGPHDVDVKNVVIKFCISTDMIQRHDSVAAHGAYIINILFKNMLTRSLPGQFFPGCHPRVGLSFVQVPAGYLLWCQCPAELRVLNDEYTMWHLPMHIS